MARRSADGSVKRGLTISLRGFPCFWTLGLLCTWPGLGRSDIRYFYCLFLNIPLLVHAVGDATKSYLRFDSGHPQHIRTAIPFGLGMRLRRICSREEDYIRHRRDTKTRLEGRGYPGCIVDRALKKLDKCDGGKGETKGGDGAEMNNEKQDSRVLLVLTYSSFLPHVRKVLQKKRYILQNSGKKLQKIFVRDPLVAFRRGTNLRDGLVHNKSR